MPRRLNLFGDTRLPVGEAVSMTVDSLQAHGPSHRHWAIAWSGGKDSTTLVTLLIYLLEAGKIDPPETLTVLYADTRLEITPLWIAAQEIAQVIRARNYPVRTVMAPLDKRFLVYILGRGVPPPNNNTFRWCTRQIKVEPMAAELKRLHGEKSEKILTLTGVRQGESAVRDAKIAMSCGINGAECGQGWYQETMPDDLCDTLAPILHWRVCNVWDWLRLFAPRPGWGGWPTQILADAYGGDEAVEINARTGCIGCPLANRDTALEAIVQMPQWAYLAPLLEIKPIWRWLREPQHRLRKPGGERRKDGSLSKNQHRMGPIKLQSRLTALERILDIQDRVNNAAAAAEMPCIDILNMDEEQRIRELIEANTWPDKWTGAEPGAEEPFDEMYCDGTIQRSLFTLIPSP